jgi:xanthine dehydrogenase small subunit
MVDCHGSQCGYCTPGFVVAMTGLLEEKRALDELDWRQGLTGNLCRCTGYLPILDAAAQCAAADHQRLDELYPPDAMLADLRAVAHDDVRLHDDSSLTPCTVACPANLDETLNVLAANPAARIVAGATDVGVRINKTGQLPSAILDLNRVAELDFVRVEGGALIAGARATWTELLGAFHALCPEFARILAAFGAPQIRHVGTIGGNIANASPIADSLPFLYVMDAKVALAGRSGRRQVNVNEFFRGYKQLDLRPGELIAEVRIPLPAADELVRLYKVSRRRDLDIATFTAAIRLRVSPPPSKGGAWGGIPHLNGDAGGPIIDGASIALGGVGPTVLRARRAEQRLVGQQLTEETLRAAGELAADEITPLTDVRGAADHRRQLARNVFLKFYHQTQSEIAAL